MKIVQFFLVVALALGVSSSIAAKSAFPSLSKASSLNDYRTSNAMPLNVSPESICTPGKVCCDSFTTGAEVTSLVQPAYSCTHGVSTCGYEHGTSSTSLVTYHAVGRYGTAVFDAYPNRPNGSFQNSATVSLRVYFYDPNGNSSTNAVTIQQNSFDTGTISVENLDTSFDYDSTQFGLNYVSLNPQGYNYSASGSSSC